MVKIRLAKIDEVKAINKIMNKHISFGASTEEHVLSVMSSENSNIMVAKKKGKIVGICRFSDFNHYSSKFRNYYNEMDSDFLSENNTQGDIRCIDFVVVTPKERNKGIAKELIKACMSNEKPNYSAVWISEHIDVVALTAKFPKHRVVGDYFASFGIPCKHCGNICKCDAILILSN